MNAKRKNSISKFRTIAILGIIATAFFSQVNAQTCPTVLKSKTGKVYSANPGIVKTVAHSSQATVRIKKTGGKAETQVNIYINNVQQPNPIEFDNGPRIAKGWKTRTLSNVDGKEIKVQIVNQSVANTISYKVQIEGESKSITTTNGPTDGRLAGQTKPDHLHEWFLYA